MRFARSMYAGLPSPQWVIGASAQHAVPPALELPGFGGLPRRYDYRVGSDAPEITAGQGTAEVAMAVAKTEVESGWFSRMPRRVRLPRSVRSVSTATLLRSTQCRRFTLAGHSSLDDDLEGIPRAPGRAVESTYIHRVRTRSAPAPDPYIIEIGRADVDRRAAGPMRILGGPEVATVSC